MDFSEISDIVVFGIEAAGMAVVVIGIIVAILHALYLYAGHRDILEFYEGFRHGVGRSLTLGLDLLIASEIIRSIHAETLESVTVLGLTVVIRTFLSITLMVEVEGRWPWAPEKETQHE